MTACLNGRIYQGATSGGGEAAAPSAWLAPARRTGPAEEEPPPVLSQVVGDRSDPGEAGRFQAAVVKAVRKSRSGGVRYEVEFDAVRGQGAPCSNITLRYIAWPAA